MDRLRLTYCGNVHATDDLDGFRAGLRQHAVPVAAAARAAGRRFGLGAFLPLPVVARLVHDAAALAELRAELADLDLPLWTLNVFPMAGFHDAVVKTAVYRPDWASEERLHFTRSAAEIGALLAPPGSELPLSTLPLGYRGPADPEPDLRCMARNLARCASAFAALEARTGVRCVLALEPEPFCLLETAAEAAEFLERWLFDEGNWLTVPEPVLRRHVGVCVDLCHLFVVDEDPLQALAMLRARGIAVPKVQVSSCLEVRTADGLPRLLGFAEARYLHQTVAANGLRALDLDDVGARRAEFANAGRIRTHYHMPLYWDADGPFGSTRRDVERVLRGLAAAASPLPLLEVETYTWSVLGDFAGDEPLAARLSRELDFAAKPFQR